MADVKLFKETVLPGTLQANAIYYIAPAAKPGYIEIYVTDVSAIAKRVIDEARVQEMIDAAAAAAGGATVVADITARDALSPASGAEALVEDASADATVSSGGARYYFNGSAWIKTTEIESMDLILSWANLTGKPTSSVANIDAAVTNSHTHANKTELDKISEDVGGFFNYNGVLPHVGWDSTGW